MLPRLIGAAALSVALMQGAAFAGDKDKSAMDKSSTTGMNQSAQSLPQEFESKLQAQGFTEVEVVPGSYIISAKDKDGNPIHAVITPTSFTVLSLNTSGSSETTGSAPNSSSSKSNTDMSADADKKDDLLKNEPGSNR